MIKKGLFVAAIFLLIANGGIMAVAAGGKYLIVGTTTSVQDSGLLDVLNSMFEKKTGFSVKAIAVGSGQALALGRRGEVDVLFVHSPAEEKVFMEEGFGKSRAVVMYNEFAIVGPPADPAGVKSVRSPVAALKNIAKAKSLFISRGDNSGTHAKERALWEKARINPIGQVWYQETGLGMGQTLRVASEKGAYTLTDRGTYLSLKKTLSLEILSAGGRGLLNEYSVIVLNPNKFPKINISGAQAYFHFLTSREAQKLIGSFGKEKFGSALFYPAGK